MRATKLLELAGIAEEIDNFEELFLGFLDAGHVLERHLVAIHRQETCLAFAEGHRATTGGLHLLAEQEKQHAHDQKQGKEHRKHAAQVILVPLVARGIVDELFQIISLDRHRNGNAEWFGPFDFPVFSDFLNDGLHHLSGANNDGIVRAGGS